MRLDEDDLDLPHLLDILVVDWEHLFAGVAISMREEVQAAMVHGDFRLAALEGSQRQKEVLYPMTYQVFCAVY